jgi:hypothetical protein
MVVFINQADNLILRTQPCHLHTFERLLAGHASHQGMPPLGLSVLICKDMPSHLPVTTISPRVEASS